MTEPEFINLLGFGIAVTWFCKIGFHFVYLKAADKSIKELNFISSYLKIEKFFASFLLISSFFFSSSVTEVQALKITKRNAKVSTYVLWIMFAVTGFYLYNHTSKKEPTRIEYDSARRM